MRSVDNNCMLNERLTHRTSIVLISPVKMKTDKLKFRSQFTAKYVRKLSKVVGLWSDQWDGMTIIVNTQSGR